ncbi:MAG: pyrroline-5-carboxylate reductase [Candidatus Binataceae bacterium]
MKKLGFIGAGNMAEALARGVIENKVFKASEMIASDVDAARRRKFKGALKIEVTTDNLKVLNSSRAVLFAVKPQTIDAVLTELARAGSYGASAARKNGLNSKLFVSIAAGVTLNRLESALGGRARVIRVMPNAPAMVGQGMAALVRGRSASRADEAFALGIFRSVGDALTLKDEALLDAVTALSGSGPAYIYLFAKSLADAAVTQGLPADLALRMALKTIRGAEENMRRSRLTADDLIRIVASPGGTTEAALKQLGADGFSDIVARAIHAAAERSRELGRTS